MLCFTCVSISAIYVNKVHCIQKSVEVIEYDLDQRAVYSWPPSQGSWECLIQTHFSIYDRNFPFESSQGKKWEGMGGKLVRSEADMSAVSLRGPET